MLLLEFLFAFVIGFLLVVLFSAFFRDHLPWGSFWLLLLIVFLGTWAVGAWITPFGPTLFNVAWLPFVLIGLFITILLFAAVPAPPEPRTIEQARETQEERSALAGLTIFFWITLVFAIVAIALAYII